MLGNYLIVALRNLLRQRLYTAINVVGLGVGIAFCLLTFAYLHNEATYDAFHPLADQLHRVLTIGTSPGGERTRYAVAPDALPTALRTAYPEIQIAGLWRRTEWLRIGDQDVEQDLCFTDPDFLELFAFPLLVGQREAVLESPGSIVLSRSLADRYFGEADPVGRTVTLRMVPERELTVTGVIEDPPSNTTIAFEALVPMALLHQVDPGFENKWYSLATHTFVRCPPGLDLQEAVDQVYTSHSPGWLREKQTLASQPLTDIHLGPTTRNEIVPNASPGHLLLLTSISLAVLAIACVNYVNLATALFSERTAEAGIRRAIGAQRGQVLSQFLTESTVIALLAMGLGLGLAELSLPAFTRLLHKEFSLAMYYQWWSAGVLLGVGILIGLASGACPALLVSGSRPRLAPGGRTSRPMSRLRWVLVIGQLSAGTALVAGVLVVLAQLEHMREHALGFDPERIIAMPTSGYDDPDVVPKIRALLAHVGQQGWGAGILSHTVSENVPGSHYHNRFGLVAEGQTEGNRIDVIVTSIDDRFLSTYGIELVAGRGFAPDEPAGNVLISARTARDLGLGGAVGKRLRYSFGEGPFTVIGVVSDIHIESLNRPLKPVFYRYAHKPRMARFVSVRIRSDRTEEATEFLREAWPFSGPFRHWFVDDSYRLSYDAEERLARLVGTSGVFAIALASFGLFGLAAVTARHRTKEIGIRKAVGAKASDIVELLSREFATRAVVAAILATPMALVVCRQWLQSYPYRVSLGPQPFLASALTMLAVVMVTVSLHAVRAAWANPVDALRHE